MSTNHEHAITTGHCIDAWLVYVFSFHPCPLRPARPTWHSPGSLLCRRQIAQKWCRGVYESGRRSKIQSLERAPSEEAGESGSAGFDHGQQNGTVRSRIEGLALEYAA
jgi:hypothetical protein